jgi:hypothetical protein
VLIEFLVIGGFWKVCCGFYEEFVVLRGGVEVVDGEVVLGSGGRGGHCFLVLFGEEEGL